MEEVPFASYQQLLKDSIQSKYEFVKYQVDLFKQFHLKVTVHSAALSRNGELLVCGCGKNIIVLYDLIAKKTYNAINTNNIHFRKHQIISVAFSHCYDYLIAGNTMGDLLVYQINREDQEFTVDLIQFMNEFHPKPIHTIYHSSVDRLVLISSTKLSILNLSEIIYLQTDQSLNYSINIDTLNSVLVSKISYYNDNYYLYLGQKDGSIYSIKLTTLNNFSKPALIYTLPKSAIISQIAVTNDQSLLALSYQQSNEDGHLIIYYLKRNKLIYQQTQLTKLKISCLSFFNDNTHLIIASWDGSFQILDIKKKLIIAKYSHQLHSQGVIALFQIQEMQQFPNIITVGQEHIIKKTYFGVLKETLFEHIPFIFWVEQRIRQELQFQSDILNYQKLLVLETMGVDSVRQKELNASVFGFEAYAPLLKRMIDFADYQVRCPSLYQRYIQQQQQQQQQPQPQQDQTKKIMNQKLPPLQQSESLVNNVIQKPQEGQINPIDANIQLFRKIQNTFEFGRIQMLILCKCPFLFDSKLPYYEHIQNQFSKFKLLKYLDLSYNSLNIIIIQDILEQLKGIISLDFLNLAHNNIGENGKILSANTIMSLLDDILSVSLRSNRLSDYDGETILNQIKYFKKLKILDISGNLDFGAQTLQALQRITILQNKIEFSQKRNDIMDFINKMQIMQDKQMQEELEENEEQIPPSISQKILKNPNVDQNEDDKLLAMDADVRTIDRQSSSNSIVTDMSLELLCLQFRPERCEEAMKTATDFLVQRQITNLYIYVVDNKIDNVWESSISVFYTRRIKKITDYISGLIGGFFYNFCIFFYNLYKTIRNDGYYCLKRIFCSTLCLYKYCLCVFCTVLTTTFGKLIVKIFGVESSYYEYNPKSRKLEEKLKDLRYILFPLFFIYFIAFYFVIVFLPIIFVNNCSGQDWAGHLIYLSFAVYSFFFEGSFGLTISQIKVTTNEYTDGNCLSRSFYIIKDLLLSQLTKFQFYANICFIVVIYSCQIYTVITWIGVGVIGVNLLFDIALIFRYLLVPYIYQQNLTYVDVFCQFSTLYQMNIVTNLLEKWTEQNTISIIWFKDVPQKVVVSIIKAFFLDIPLLLLQIIYFALNPEKIQIGILLVSFITSIIQGVFSNIKMLSITKAAKINEDIILNEYSVKLQNKQPKSSPELSFYLRKFTSKLMEWTQYLQSKNRNTYLCLRDSEQANLRRPHTVFNQEIEVNHNKIVPLKALSRRGITLLGNKVQRVNVSKKKIIECEPYYKKQSVKAALDLFGTKIKSWKLKDVPSLDCIDVLLVDVPRQIFCIDLEWDNLSLWLFNIKISSLGSEIVGIYEAYKRFQSSQKVIVLDIGYGSGYISFVLGALAIRCNCQIQIYMIDHQEKCELQFKQKLDSYFQWMKSKCQFTIITYDCLQSFDKILNQQKFDFIHLGCATTKWRINNYIIPMLAQDGILYGYEISSSLEQNGFLYKNIATNENKEITKLNLTNVNFGIMEPLRMAVDQTQHASTISLREYTLLTFQIKQCGLCEKKLEPSEKQFINPYWGEVICFDCGIKDLEDQGEQIDMARIHYKSNVIYYTGQGDYWGKINELYLQNNQTLRSGIKQAENRGHQVNCKSCGIKKSYGYLYKCLICSNVNYCNKCGLKFIDNTFAYHVTCSNEHLILRCIFKKQ